MKSLIIPFIPQQEQSHVRLPFHPIAIEPWAKSREPSCIAAFSISHYNTGISITYTVNEPVLNARKRKINGEVHKDNCVEFFIAFGDGLGYYNFEFNCLGSVKAAFGKGRNRRKYVPEDMLKTVADSIVVAINNVDKSTLIQWDITVDLPLSVFSFHNISMLSGLTCTANFAKCGDDLPIPHFLSWVELTSPNPDFHQPSSFGQITFLGKEQYNNLQASSMHSTITP